MAACVHAHGALSGRVARAAVDAFICVVQDDLWRHARQLQVVTLAWVAWPADWVQKTPFVMDGHTREALQARTSVAHVSKHVHNAKHTVSSKRGVYIGQRAGTCCRALCSVDFPTQHDRKEF
eukprot:1156521-Pelagomonas_calceolata.AAC.10